MSKRNYVIAAVSLFLLLKVHGGSEYHLGSFPDATEPSAAKIQQALMAMASGDTLIIPSGEYLMTERLGDDERTSTLKDHITIEGDSTNPPIFKPDPNALYTNNYLFYILRRKNITLRNIVFDGDNRVNQGIICSAFNQNNPSDSLFLHNLEFRNFNEVGIIFNQYVTNSRIFGCKFTDGLNPNDPPMTWAIKIKRASLNNIIENNWIESSNTEGIEITASTGSFVRNNTVLRTGLGTSAGGISIEAFGNCHETVIENNFVDNWISIADRSSKCAVRSNHIDSDYGVSNIGFVAIEIANAKNAIATDNKTYNSRGGISLDAHHAHVGYTFVARNEFNKTGIQTTKEYNWRGC